VEEGRGMMSDGGRKRDDVRWRKEEER